MGSTEKHSDEVPGFSFQLAYPGLEIGEVRKPEISRRTDQKSIQNPAPSIKMTRTREAKRDRKLLDSNYSSPAKHHRKALWSHTYLCKKRPTA